MIDVFVKVQDKYFEADYKGSYSLCVNGSKNGNIKCIRFMGWFYYTGNGVKEDLKTALDWFDKASKYNDAEAFFGKGAVLYRQKKYSKSYENFYSSSALGFYPAFLRLGMMSKLGLGVEKNIDSAYGFYFQASKRGSLIAERLIIKMLFSGYKGWKGRLKAIPMLIKVTIMAFIKAFKNDNDPSFMY